MSNNITKPNSKALKELFETQCTPCVQSPDECEGNQTDAGEWRCPEFVSGFFTAQLGEKKTKEIEKRRR